MIKKLLIVLFITLPIIAHSQFSGALALMKVDTNPEFDQYEKILFDATEFIFDNPKLAVIALILGFGFLIFVHELATALMQKSTNCIAMSGPLRPFCLA